MAFTSINFLLFFGLVLGGYYFFNARFRVKILLFSSYFFYLSWDVYYGTLLFAITLISYFGGILISMSEKKRVKIFWLSFSMICVFAFLLFFKYYGFFRSNLAFLSQFIWHTSFDIPELNYLIPIGLSFYTFQSISYIIDVFKGKIKPEIHILKYSLYISFFPLLISGPIERAVNLLPQLSKKIAFNYALFRDGILLMIWGFFKKLVIADRLSVYVDAVYKSPADSYGLQIWVATFFYSIQIYCDFSGYTDIARGTAKCFGINLTQNFQRPYLADSIQDFWRRWHISLSRWFRDYLYIPLGGNRCGLERQLVNVLVVFSAVGLWHGAKWNFIVWGILHGLFLLFELLIKKILVNKQIHFSFFNRRLFTFLKVCYVYSSVCFAWIFFRSNTFGDAILLISNSLIFSKKQTLIIQDGLSELQLILSWLLIVFLLILDLLQEKFKEKNMFAALSIPARWSVYFSLVFSIILLGVYDGDLPQFIYFQF